MAEVNIIGKTNCPWCHNDLEVVKSPKSGYHYANCTSCNAHFRNIPVALVDMKEKQTPQAEPETKESALEWLRRKYGQTAESKKESPREAYERFLVENGIVSEAEESLKRIRREFG